MSLSTIPRYFFHSSKWFHHFPGKSVLMLNNPFSEHFFPNMQSKSLSAKFEAICSCPATYYLGEETKPNLTTASFPVLVGSNKVSVKETSLPHHPGATLAVTRVTYPTWAGAVTAAHPTLTQLHQISLGLEHCPGSAGHAIPHTGQDAIGLFDHLGTLLAHVQSTANLSSLPPSFVPPSFFLLHYHFIIIIISLLFTIYFYIFVYTPLNSGSVIWSFWSLQQWVYLWVIRVGASETSSTVSTILEKV